MKKVILASLIMFGLSAASYGQTAPAPAKQEPSKMKVVKKEDHKKEAKVVPLKPAPAQAVKQV
ncbi:MAG TPA: hypothetical protein PLS00_15910, partial [Niabella sp.]|nr:hypothetical protein [Niabella sp.]